MGSRTEEGGDLTSQEEAAAEEVEVEVGKEELLAGTTTTMISALILDRLPPAGTCFCMGGNGEVPHNKILSHCSTLYDDNHHTMILTLSACWEKITYELSPYLEILVLFILFIFSLILMIGYNQC